MATAVNNSNRSSLFVNSPGKARATIPGHGINAHGPQGKTATVGGCLNRKGKPASSPTKGNSTKRYFKQFSYKTNGPETGATYSVNSCFQSFKNRFSANSRAGHFGRPFKAFSAKLATNYGRSRDFRRSTGLQTRVSCSTKSRTHPTPPAVFVRGVGENRLRGCYPPRERRFEYGQAGFRPVFKQLVFGAQTGREISLSNKSKGTECISEVRAFQNGRHSSSSRSASASRLAGENRFERCVLRDPNLEGSQEIPSIFLEEFSPGICMPPLWPGGGPKTVHKSVETGGCSSPPSRNTSDNISGRSFVYESVQRGARSRHGHSTVSVRESRFRDQSRKVLLRSNTDLGVSQFCSEHSGYDSAPSRLQSGIYKIPLQLSPSASRSVCKRSLPVDWEVDRFNSGNISGPPALPLSPALKTPSFSPTKGLRCNNTSVE